MLKQVFSFGFCRAHNCLPGVSEETSNLEFFESEKTLRALGDGLISLYNESNMSLGVLEGPIFDCQVDRVNKLQG